LKEDIRTSLIEAGFDACGFTDTAILPKEQRSFFQQWLKNNYHAAMRYMENNMEKRLHPALLVENAKSIIVVAINFFSEQKPAGTYRISKYAYGKDYHDVIKEKLAQVVQQIPKLRDDPMLRIFTDSAPLAERFLAVRAGIGFIGKNNTLIIPKRGSFFFLAEIVTSLALPPDEPFAGEFCGRCSRCLDACPTKALMAPFTLDAEKCISYQTIENKGNTSIPTVREGSEKWIFGCDACMDACPWNRFAVHNATAEFQPDKSLLSMTDTDWECLDEEKFTAHFNKSPLKRAGFYKLKQNIESVRGVG
jgi:epoxyqueuosine reductase